MSKKIAVIFILFILLVLSSCAPVARNVAVNTRTPVPNNSQTVTDTTTALASSEIDVQLSASPSDLMQTGFTVQYVPSNTQPETTTSPDVDDIISDPSSYGYGKLPIPLVKLSESDINKFNPEKAKDYLLAAFSGYNNIYGSLDYDYCYSADKAQIIDNKVYLTISLSLSVEDADDAYCFFADEFSLKDKDIIKLSPFSKCVIRDDYMYNSKEAWEDRRSYNSIED